ncbi:hypothetical protein [Arenibacter latericius]|uniref:hypothetical protein n=1 Tax=Arenibacter latericius TaxID=86104 RepID=UPI000405089F|nr:hypothetical protein [Arenibacter latericius]
MKKLALLSLAAILTTSCNGQEKIEKEQIDNNKQITEQPKGTWKVDKEYDEKGNLIRYDSIYSWSSTDNLGELMQSNPDSLMKSLQSRFYSNFKGFNNQRFQDLFAKDSLFTKQFFNNDFFESEFGQDFMDIDRLRERMETMQKQFLNRYQAEFEELHEMNPKSDE